jgi:hypothetical protein
MPHLERERPRASASATAGYAPNLTQFGLPARRYTKVKS